MRVLLVGSGGREHALGWKLAASPRVTELLSLPGNPGLTDLGPVVEGVSPLDVGAVAAIARVHRVDLVVVGPEAPLAAGLADAVARLGIPVFGPSRMAARLESSKAFAKDVMRRAEVPAAEGWVFTEQAPAEDHIRTHPGPYVVKADGLAAGKGVLVTEDAAAALSWVADCFGGRFGEAGKAVLVEEHLTGPELSVFAVCDGRRALTLEPARDYKRLGDGDTGPNTGGMGSFSPVGLPAGLLDEVERRVFVPTLAAMAENGTPYVGFLYAGLVLTADGPKVIEFNCRLGDPETQVVVPRLQTDLVDVLDAALGGTLDRVSLAWSPGAAVNVVLAAAGYPDSPRSGDVVGGLDRVPEDVLAFHAGTAREGRRLVTAGGRVLNLVGLGETIAEARRAAYRGAHTVSFRGKQFRTDIAAEEAS